MKKILLVLILYIFQSSFGQTATIKLKNPVYAGKEAQNPIKFEFNGQRFGEKDTIIRIKLNKNEFDVCKVTAENYVLDFITKFKANETYQIHQGCCCADFTLEAEKKPKRGIVIFKNKTKKDLGFLIAGIESDTVAAGKKKIFFATESAMCYFKSSEIQITETEYLSEKYYYNHTDNYKALEEEQKKYLLDSKWFHFLHGEKIEIILNPLSNKMDVKLKGYLTDKEYLQFINGFD